MAQKYIEDDFVMTRTEPNNFTPMVLFVSLLTMKQ